MSNPSEPARTRRKRTKQPQTSEQPAAEAACVHVIEPTGIYYPSDFQRIFRLRDSTLRREIRKNRLRVSRRGGHYVFLGQWLLEWVAGGEVKRSQPTPAIVPQAE